MAAGTQETWVPHFSRAVGARSGEVCQTEVKNAVPREAAAEKARRERRRALILPREHGAWGLLLVPMVTAAGVAFRESNHILPLALLLTAALAVFWLRTPVESLLGTAVMRAQTRDERQAVSLAIAVLGAIAALALSALLWAGRNPYLWWIGITAGVAFVGQALLKLMWRRPPRPSRDGEAERPGSTRSAHRLRMLSEIVGTIGLTSSAPAAYYVITGKLGATAWMLWLANLIFAGNQIHYVQLRIHTAKVEGAAAKFAKGWTFALGQVVMLAVLTGVCWRRLMPWLALIAFAPILFRGWIYFFQKPRPLLVRQLGWNELKQAVVFCALFIAAFALGR